MTLLEQAIKLAVEAHGGQTDKDGCPHILHSLEVMFSVKEEIRPEAGAHHLLVESDYTLEELMVAAVLHDVAEDTDVTLGGIEERFGKRVAHVVDCLTRRVKQVPKETYRDFIYRTKSDPASRFIKVADLLNNTGRLGRIKVAHPKWHDKLEYKYDTALRVLNDSDEPTWETASRRLRREADGEVHCYMADPNGKEIECDR